MLRQSEITTDAVTLVWTQPESKRDYTYNVRYSNGTFINTTTTTTTTITISQLLSGSNYSFTVITLAADGTQSEPVTVSNFTRMYTCKPSREKPNMCANISLSECAACLLIQETLCALFFRALKYYRAEG